MHLADKLESDLHKYTMELYSTSFFAVNLAAVLLAQVSVSFHHQAARVSIDRCLEHIMITHKL